MKPRIPRIVQSSELPKKKPCRVKYRAAKDPLGSAAQKPTCEQTGVGRVNSIQYSTCVV